MDALEGGKPATKSQGTGSAPRHPDERWHEVIA
jgi:hypothetical protein